MANRRLIYIISLASFLLVASLLAIAARAELVQGNTANGCSYQVINGEYRYNCPAKTPGGSALRPSALVVDQTAPSTVSPQIQTETYQAAPQLMPVTIMAPQDQSRRVRGDNARLESNRREHFQEEAREISPFDSVYAGVQVGSDTISESNNSSTALGVTLGTDIDEFLGLEIGYSYSKQNMLLGLANRSGPETNPYPTNSYSANPTSDSNLTSNLLSAELQCHLTEAGRRLRPYAGAGLAWKSSTLSETLPQQVSYGSYGNSYSAGNTQLNQKSLGALASLGTTFRVTRTIQIAGAFRYFLPISRQDPVLSGGMNGVAGNSGALNTHLNSNDKELTGSSQYQLVAGLQVYF